MTIARRIATLLVGVGAVLLCWSATAMAAAPEKPVTEGVTAITGTTATFNGELNPGAGSERLGYYFTYARAGEPCDGEDRRVVFSQSEPQAEGNHRKVAVAITGLEASSEYAVCLVAYSLHEEAITVGTSEHFTTPAEKPVVVSESPTDITPFAATLQAEVNPENQTTSSCMFEYGETDAYGQTGACLPSSIAGPQAAVVSLPIAGLGPGKPYHYRVIATNTTGTVVGEDDTFETEVARPPSVDSEGAAQISSDDAKLEAKVNPAFQPTEYRFEYATAATEQVLEGAITTVPGSPPGPPLAAAGEDQLAGPVDLAGKLAPGTTYFYRLTATNATGTTEGAVGSFETLAALPTVSAGQPEAVTGTIALLSGSIDPQGGQTFYHAVYLTRSAYEEALTTDVGDPFLLGKTTPGAVVPAGNAPTAVVLAAEELAPGTSYEFVFVARNSAGTTVGPPATFVTPITAAVRPGVIAHEQGGESAGQPYAPIAPPFPTLTPPPVIPYQSIAQLLAKEPKVTAAMPTAVKCRKGEKRRHGKCVRSRRRKRSKGKKQKS